jgi:hypothetical protein
MDGGKVGRRAGASFAFVFRADFTGFVMPPVRGQRLKVGHLTIKTQHRYVEIVHEKSSTSAAVRNFRM